MLAEFGAVTEKFAAEVRCRRLFELLDKHRCQCRSGELELGDQLLDFAFLLGEQGAGLKRGELLAELLALALSELKLILEMSGL